MNTSETEKTRLVIMKVFNMLPCQLQTVPLLSSSQLLCHLAVLMLSSTRSPCRRFPPRGRRAAALLHAAAVPPLSSTWSPCRRFPLCGRRAAAFLHVVAVPPLSSTLNGALHEESVSAFHVSPPGHELWWTRSSPTSANRRQEK